MGKYTIEESTLVSLASAVRAKTGITSTLSPQDMATAINKLYVPKDILTEKNLSKWKRNMEGFSYTVSYEDNGIEIINKIQGFSGVSGYERLYLPITVKKNTNYCFVADYCSPTGFPYQDHDNLASEYGGETLFVFGSEPIGTHSPNSTVNGTTRFNVIGRSVALDPNPSTEYKRYSISFNSGEYTTVYLSLSMGYIKDTNLVDLYFKNLALYTL